MRNIVWIILLVAVARAQNYKLCAPFDEISETSCTAIQRGESRVSCFRVTDRAECAIRLAQGEADFGVLNAEELLLAYQFYKNSITPILQMRHRDKPTEDFEFQTVAVIRADISQNILNPKERFNSLKNGGLCHPGFSQSQWWNDYILEYFEKTMTPSRCEKNLTVTENKIRNIRDFFGKACRPGDWASEDTVDKELKEKYPELCALCDNQTNCTYKNNDHHGHLGALECLTKGNGKVAYVALSYVYQYLGRNESFQLLCPDGTVRSLSGDPCAWIKQPWSVIAARNGIAATLKSELLQWLQSEKFQQHPDSWKHDLSTVLQEDSWAHDISEKMSLVSYLSKGREVELGNTQTVCDRTVRWCTVSDQENEKCLWVMNAMIILGVEPKISCIKSNSTFQCFREISENRADIIAIDSNYGYLARTVYGLSTVLYSETEMNRNSVIIAVVREPNDNNYPVKSFHDLKNRKACFPEYGGIGWLSFVNVARTNGVISSRSCDYPLLMSKLLSGACTPGIEDVDHSRTTVTADISSKLCSACLHKNNTSCAVNETNPYYGDNGAIKCITEGAGDVAFVEAANIGLLDNTINQHMYRILCKNGSLAENSGFNFDEFCALSVTIDSEVVGRKNDDQVLKSDIVLALLKTENWLGYHVNTRRTMHIYGPFNNTLDLLFKDSTSGLLVTSATKKSVLAYKELFDHVDACSSGYFSATANFIFVALVALYHVLSSHVH